MVEISLIALLLLTAVKVWVKRYTAVVSLRLLLTLTFQLRHNHYVYRQTNSHRPPHVSHVRKKWWKPKNWKNIQTWSPCYEWMVVLWLADGHNQLKCADCNKHVLSDLPIGTGSKRSVKLRLTWHQSRVSQCWHKLLNQYRIHRVSKSNSRTFFVCNFRQNPE